jgi:hypothetical protein
MRVDEAKEMVLTLATVDAELSGQMIAIDARSPDGDEGKFRIAGKTARAIHHFDGWYVPINLDWFRGSFDEPSITGSSFYWYAFAIPRRNRYLADHYLICDYLQVRDWVLSFSAPLGRDHRDHRSWRADLRLYPDIVSEVRGYFRWGDEPIDDVTEPARVFELDNIATAVEPVPFGQHVGSFGAGGESAAHRQLKLYVAHHPIEFGLGSSAVAKVEYPFVTGDRVDVLFENRFPDRTVVEVEVEGEQNICIGIHQAVKYRALAAVDSDFPLATSRVRAMVVAYGTDYPLALRLSDRYEVPLVAVDRDLVLASAS